jgi:hypothetical protein
MTRFSGPVTHRTKGINVAILGISSSSGGPPADDIARDEPPEQPTASTSVGVPRCSRRGWRMTVL